MSHTPMSLLLIGNEIAQRAGADKVRSVTLHIDVERAYVEIERLVIDPQDIADPIKKLLERFALVPIENKGDDGKDKNKG